MGKITIGVLAREAGVGVETVRYYQRIGLLNEPPKPLSGYRTYKQQDVDQIRFIQRAKTLGFSLAEVAAILKLGSESCNETRTLAADKLTDVRAKIRDLSELAATLESLISSCDQNIHNENCPIISTIIDGKRSR